MADCGRAAERPSSAAQILAVDDTRRRLRVCRSARFGERLRGGDALQLRKQFLRYCGLGVELLGERHAAGVAVAVIAPPAD
jgi:hypothetical protein